MKERVFLHLRHYTRSARPLRLHHALLTKPLARSVLNLRIVAEARKPVDAGIFAEPGQLPFCVLSRGLLNRHARFFKLLISSQNLAQFTISDKIERLRILWQAAFHQTPHFFHPSA